MDNTEIDGGDDKFLSPPGRKYSPVVADDSAVVEMLSMDPSSSSSNPSMTGEQNHVPLSPRDGEDVSITLEHPKITEVKLGTMMGVFLPCLQNILGIIYYIRFTWIVGMAGIAESLLLVAFCCLSTFLTAVSLSAIATNGAMKGGGPYYLIGRALGPEVGVSIGLCFFLGTAVAGALYVLGAVETFLDALLHAGIFTKTIT